VREEKREDGREEEGEAQGEYTGEEYTGELTGEGEDIAIGTPRFKKLLNREILDQAIPNFQVDKVMGADPLSSLLALSSNLSKMRRATTVTLS
jgi:hypothetical protein